jgi:undecaprenyl pyrophosphate phosphatase UppP
LAGSFPFIANFKKIKVKTTDYSSSWLAVFIGVSRSWAMILPNLLVGIIPMIINHQSFISSIPISFIAEIHWHQSSEDLALHLVEGAQSQRADSLGIVVFGEMEVS